MISVKWGYAQHGVVKLGGLPKGSDALRDVALCAAKQSPFPSNDHPSAHRHAQQGNSHKAGDKVTFKPKGQ
jgi:hypothetical protein